MTTCSLIGFGNWGKILHKNILLFKNLDLKYICKKKIDAQNIKNQKIIFTDDYKKAINNVEVVFIAAPPETHFEIAKYALENKKNVFIEKPVCLKSNEFNQLISIANQYSLVLHVNYIHIYNNNFTSLVDKFKSNIQDTSDINVKILIGNNGPIRKNTSPLFDWGPHVFSILNYIVNINDYKFSKGKVFYKNKDKYNIYLNYLKNNYNIKILFGNNFSMKNIVVKMQSNNLRYTYLDSLSYIEDKITNQKINFEIKSPLENSISQFLSYCKFYKQDLSMMNITKNLEYIKNKYLK